MRAADAFVGTESATLPRAPGALVGTTPAALPRSVRSGLPWSASSRRVVPLGFVGGDFDEGYNARQTPSEFSIPASFSRARLVATITGHGSDENNCAEFCPTEHIFEISVLSKQRIGQETRITPVAGKAGPRSGPARGGAVVSTVVSKPLPRGLRVLGDNRFPDGSSAEVLEPRFAHLGRPAAASSLPSTSPSAPLSPILGSARNLSLSFDVAGTEWGCTAAVLSGSVPNEHGTWEYGRGGWCDGAPVPATVWDVTQAIRAQVDDGSGADLPAEEELAIRVSYWGLYRGATPRPLAPRPGAIIISASLVVDA